jgi:hypothetical protein
MPTRWDDWVAVIVSTHGTWLPGDPRGFRDHDHRIHSSGDSKRPPPSGEHAGLHRYARRHADPEVVIPPELHPPVAETFGEKLLAIGCPPRILAIGKVRGHILFSVGAADAKLIIGRAKQLASHRVRDRLPDDLGAELPCGPDRGGIALPVGCPVHPSPRAGGGRGVDPPGPSRGLRSGVPRAHSGSIRWARSRHPA